MEATFKGNHKTKVYPNWIGYYKLEKIEATFKGNANLQLLKLKWVLYVLNMQGQEICKALLEATSVTLAFFICKILTLHKMALIIG